MRQILHDKSACDGVLARLTHWEAQLAQSSACSPPQTLSPSLPHNCPSDSSSDSSAPLLAQIRALQDQLAAPPPPPVTDPVLAKALPAAAAAGSHFCPPPAADTAFWKKRWTEFGFIWPPAVGRDRFILSDVWEQKQLTWDERWW